MSRTEGEGKREQERQTFQAVCTFKDCKLILVAADPSWLVAVDQQLSNGPRLIFSIVQTTTTNKWLGKIPRPCECRLAIIGSLSSFQSF